MCFMPMMQSLFGIKLLPRTSDLVHFWGAALSNLLTCGSVDGILLGGLRGQNDLGLVSFSHIDLGLAVPLRLQNLGSLPSLGFCLQPYPCCCSAHLLAALQRQEIRATGKMTPQGAIEGASGPSSVEAAPDQLLKCTCFACTSCVGVSVHMQ